MIHQIKYSIDLPVPIEETWRFFSDPSNLELITPSSLGFRITSERAVEMYPGQIISYSVSPIFKFPMLWVTEITHVQKPNYFVDEQRYGPYRMWHHQHRFTEISGGTRVEDTVDYILPFGPFGEIAHILFVKRQLESIFSHRERVLRERFGAA